MTRTTPIYRAGCRRCSWHLDAMTREAAVAAGRVHQRQHRTAPDPTPDRADRFRWRGQANKTQRALLVRADTGALTGHLCRVTIAGRETVEAHAIRRDLLQNGASFPAAADHNSPWPGLTGPAAWVWYPTDDVPRRAAAWLPGLVAARLIMPPRRPDDPRPALRGVYRITPMGRAALAASEERTAR